MRMLSSLATAGLLSLGPVLLVSASANPQQHAVIGAWGIETSNMSPTIRPGNDFYRYVNDGWLKTATIPSGFPINGSFIDAQLRTDAQLKLLMTKIVAEPTGPAEQQISELYKSYADMDLRNKNGLQPIRKGLNAIASAKNREQLAGLSGQPFQGGFFASGVAVNQADPHHYSTQLVQSSLPMPPAYFLTEGEPYAGHRAAYRDYVEQTLSQAQVVDAAGNAAKIVALETAIAKLLWTPAEKGDAVRNHHPMTLSELDEFAPGFAWKSYFAGKGMNGQSTIVVRTDTAVQKLASLFAATPLDTLKALMAYRYVAEWSPYLSDEMQVAHFDFFDKRLGGISGRRPLDERAVGFVASDNMLGNSVGRLYVAQNFPASYRDELSTIIGYVRQAFDARIDALDWMDDATRKEAKNKLKSIGTLLAYPDRWTDYSKVRVDDKDLVGNMQRLTEFNEAYNWALLKDTRRDWEFSWSPQTINAGYTPFYNRVEFPAAVLQPPFFDPNADPAVNFGAIAAVIGHEMGHAFDNQGSATDADGRLRNWWTDGSKAEFAKRGAKLAAQFDQYSPVAGAKVNGQQTLGENIGDLCGMLVGHDAYRRYVDEKQGGKAPVLDGFTGDQRFFLAWAQLWRTKASDDYWRMAVQVDPHSPAEFRVNGLMRNIDAWYAAFDVKQGDTLYLPPEERVRIW